MMWLGTERNCIPTVTLPTSRVPAMDVLTTGMCSDSSDSNTLHSENARDIYQVVLVIGLGPPETV